jgi:PPOX class probable F420-dependent enzyme
MPERPDIRLTPEEQAQFFRDVRKCALATVDKDGFPHVVAMNYFVKDDAFYMTSYGKAQKVLNVRREPKVGLMIETGSNYAELKGVMVRGTCEIIEGADAVAQAFADMVETRGGSYSRPAGASSSAPKRVVMKITPYKVMTWDHAKLGGRY